MKRSLLIVFSLFMVLVLVGCGGEDEAASTFGDNDAPAPDAGVVQVALVWDEPVDLDLEIWDGTGVSAITSSGLDNGVDVLDNTGAEYVDFDGDLATGTYVASVYFAEETAEIESATARLIVTDADGDVSEYEGTVLWEEGKDQWHAFDIDAATGEFEEINEYVLIEITE